MRDLRAFLATSRGHHDRRVADLNVARIDPRRDVRRTTSPPGGCGYEPPRRRRAPRSGSSFPTPLAEAIEATLPPREDRDTAAPLFPGVSADRLRTAISRACKAAGVPAFSPHDLWHRRISLLHRQGRTWAEIGRLVGQRKLSITADAYTHVLSDGRELDYATLASELVRR